MSQIDQAAFEAHVGSTTMDEVIGSLTGLLDGPAALRRPEIVQARPGAA